MLKYSVCEVLVLTYNNYKVQNICIFVYFSEYFSSFLMYYVVLYLTFLFLA